MCHSHHAEETRLHEERKARKKLQKDMKEVKKALYSNKTPSPPSFEERESNPPLPLSKDMPAMITLIPRFLLLPMQAPLKWNLTLSLVVTLDNKVIPLMHLLQSS
jgi:hypothetical protein